MNMMQQYFKGWKYESKYHNTFLNQNKKPGCLKLFFLTVIKAMIKSTLGGEGFTSAYSLKFTMKKHQAGAQGGNLEAKQEQNHGGMVLTCLLLVDCSTSFLCSLGPFFRGGTTHSELGPSIAVINLENSP